MSKPGYFLPFSATFQRVLMHRGTPSRAKVSNTSETAVESEALESGYRLAVYTTLLATTGVSYEKMRLARVDDPSSRRALADELGIDEDSRFRQL